MNGNPIGFYHFSGLDSGSQQGMLDRYGAEMPALYELREWYLNSCAQADGEQFSQLPWAYDYFDNGERILRIHRLRYRESAPIQALFPDPFATGDEADSYLAWFNRHDELRPVFRLTLRPKQFLNTASSCWPPGKMLPIRRYLS